VREAFGHFEAAAKLAPDNLEYLTAREVARQKLVFGDLKAGSQAMAAGNTIEALSRFREALQLDPDNGFARQRLRDAFPRVAQVQSTTKPEVLGEEIQLRPEAGQRSFHLRGVTRDIISQVALAYGITAIFDDSVPNRAVRLDMEDATWLQAASSLSRLTKTIWTPISARQALFASDTNENRRSLQRMSLRTFYLPQASPAQAMNDIAASLRILFEIRYLAVDVTAQTITVRADSQTLDAVTQFLQALKDQLPEVVFQVDVFEISRSFTRAIGASIPTSFTVYNVPTEIASLTSTSNQSLINELVSSGLINQANTTAIAGLIAQLLGSQNSLFSQPFALFGGGATLSALTAGPLSFNFSRDLSKIQRLQSMTLRASQGTAAIMKIGERYPVLNSTFAPIYNSSAISQVLGNQSYIAPFPSVNYEDIGFNLKVTPVIRRDNSVSLKLEMQIRSLGTQTVNGIPTINNQEFNGFISAKDGESIIAASNLTKSEARTLQGYSLLTSVPGLANRSIQETDDELMVVLTTHVVSANPEAGPIILLPNTMPH
jgi:type II secretory pathway component GspD/PulD (secretin)